MLLTSVTLVCASAVPAWKSGRARHTASATQAARHARARRAAGRGDGEREAGLARRRRPRLSAGAKPLDAARVAPARVADAAHGVSRALRKMSKEAARRADAGVAGSVGSARLGSARLGSARLGSARLGSARLGSARLGSIIEPDRPRLDPFPDSEEEASARTNSDTPHIFIRATPRQSDKRFTRNGKPVIAENPALQRPPRNRPAEVGESPRAGGPGPGARGAMARNPLICRVFLACPAPRRNPGGSPNDSAV